VQTTLVENKLFKNGWLPLAWSGHITRPFLLNSQIAGDMLGAPNNIAGAPSN